MEQSSDGPDAVVITAVVVLILACGFTIPTISRFVRHFLLRQDYQQVEPVTKFYEDEDGVASEEACKLFSARIAKYLALAVTFVGLVVSLVSSVLYEVWTSFPSLAYWFMSVTWILLLVQVAYIVSLKNSLRRFHFGFLGSATALLLFVSMVVAEAKRLQSVYNARRLDVFPILDTVQLCAALIVCVSLFSLPRRPHLTSEGLDVDGQYTVSALGRYTYAWAGAILKKAREVEKLELTDIPRLHLQMRARYLENRFSVLSGDHLLKRIWKKHWVELVFQTVFTIAFSIAEFAPQFVMLALLKLLEQRSTAPSFYQSAWGLLLALVFSILAFSWAETWVHWMVYSRLGLPLRAELSAMVFTKAMRRKDVKGVADASDDIKVDHDEGLQKTRQATVNLVGVDAKRIADFATYYYIFPMTITGFIVSIIFLWKLIGWKSLLAGFAIFIVVIPYNIFISKRFSDAQGDLMELRDKKLVIITEALQGIRQIKFSAQERQWQNRIGKMRAAELNTQWRVFYLDTCLIAVWILGPVMLSAISLAVYAYLHGALSPSTAFTAISVFGSLEMTLAVLPEMVSDGLEAWVSIKRINEYFNAPEKENIMTPGEMIRFTDASIAWPADDASEDRFVLSDLNLRFPPGELSVISGSTGSGKSLLLAALIGEVDPLGGTITFPVPPTFEECYDSRANRSDWILESAVAFVAQIPWIENASIKENIVFGFPFDGGRYRKVLKYCALERDLEILPDGDQTDIGANGINLSGGQRWRVSFARALYSRAGILILDDIFSAVDAHVGRQLFEEALTGELGRGRTRILVTHHVGLCLPKAEYTVILGDGTVQHAGRVKDLLNEGVIDDFLQKEPPPPHENVRAQSFSMDDVELRKIVSNASHRSRFDPDVKIQPKKFTEEEKRESGAVKLGVYLEYFKASGALRAWVPISVVYIAYEIDVLARSWVLNLWTSSYESLQTYFKVDPTLVRYVGLYIGLSIGVCVFGATRPLVVYRVAIMASRKLFDDITYAVLRAPLRWLDTIPVGRILNRMTADFNLIDDSLATDLSFLFYQAIQLVGIIIAGLAVSPWMILSAVVLLLICWRITSLFLAGAREVKRLESNAKSPIFEQFGSALSGLGTIRAFGKAEEYIERMFLRIDGHTRTSWYIWLFNRWLVWRLNVIGAVFATVVTAVIIQARVNASLAGFALSFALHYSSALIWAAREYASVELSMNAVERVTEYSNIQVEDQAEKSSVPAAWPTEGRVEVSDLVAGYAPDLPPVLKGLSFNIDRNQRVGVVGRTGAGKSSLTLALFRFIEARSGSIHIDGLDISDISLSTLRSRLAIIPQDPVLFSGTVRSNLDPFDNHTDHELYDALERVHLITGPVSRDEPPDQPSPEEPGNSNATSSAPTLVNAPSNKNPFSSLSSPISESGLNLSQGQRQLLTLARAIAARPKLLVMDEATSAVDMPTDTLIQRSIREEFHDATLIVIAHRLSTIADFDRVLVMDDGKAVEYGRPADLWKNDGGVFRSMVDGSGEGSKLREVLGVNE